MSSKLCRLALPVLVFRKSHLITSKSSLCFLSQIPRTSSHYLTSVPFRMESRIKLFCTHSGASVEMPASGDSHSVSILNSPNPLESLIQDPSRTSPEAFSEQNMEDVNRRISVRINEVEFQMKAVELYKAIRKMKADEILSLVENGFQQLDKTHLCICLKRLYKLSRASEYDPDLADSFQNLQSDARFQVLCILVAKKGKFLEPSVAFDMVIFMAYFGFDSNHPVMKHLLQLAQYFINDLALDQLVVLANCLSEMQATDQTQILKEAIKLLSRSRFDQLGMLTTWHKVALLDLFGDQLPYFDELLNEIWKERENLKVETSVRLLTALSFLVVRHHPLENWCLQVVEAGQDFLSVDDAIAVAKSCHKIGKCPSTLFQNLTRLKMSVEEQFQVWTVLTECGWYSEHLSCSVVGELSVRRLDQLHLPFSTAVRLLCLVGSIGKPVENLDCLKSWVEENYDKIQQLLTPAEFLDFCISIMLLGIQLENSLANVSSLTEFFLKGQDISLVEEQGMTNIEKLILMNGFTDSLTSDDRVAAHLKETNIQLPRPCSPLFGAISHLWPFAKHGRYTASGLYADHVLNFDDRTRVAVLVWPASCFWVNTAQLKSLPKLYAKRIQTDGYDVVVINKNQWWKIVERERFNFLSCRVDEARNNKDLVMW